MGHSLMSSSHRSDNGESTSENKGSSLYVDKSYGTIKNLVTSISKGILNKTSISGYDDILESDFIQQLSLNQLTPEGVIELSKAHGEGDFTAIRDSVQSQSQTHGRSQFATDTIETIMLELGIRSLDVGLTDDVVEKNRAKYGVNVLASVKSESLILIFLSQYANFLIALLATAAIVSLCLGNLAEGLSIFGVITINAIVTTYMEKSASNILAKLASLSSPTCKVLRNGKVSVLDSKQIVVGDVVLIETGDSLVADMRLFEILELQVNEALLTGESEDVKKTLDPTDPNSPFSSNLVFSSTIVTNGTGKGIVINVGMGTQVGKIAFQLKKASKKTKISPLQRGLNKLGGVIGVISVIIIIVIVIVALLCNYTDPTKPNENRILAILLLAIGFAVSSIPEGLPMIVTISLSLGANDMAKCNANIRKLPAVETLGCCSAICTDKTGTLTQGKMTAVTVVTFTTPAEQEDSTTPIVETFNFFPTLGFDPTGGIFHPQAINTIEIPPNNKFDREYFMNHPHNLAAPGNNSPESKRIKVSMLAGFLNCHRSFLRFQDNQFDVVGNMTEASIVVAAAKAGFGYNGVDAHDLYPRLSILEVPFSSQRKMMITFHTLPKESFDSLNLGESCAAVAVVKGAPDVLAQYCTQVLKNGPNPTLANVEDLDMLICETNITLSIQAFRVLLIALCVLTKEDLQVLETLDSFERQEYVLNKRLVALSLIGSLDPPRPGVREAIDTCGKAGVRVIMITGDQKETATAIAKQVGIISDDQDHLSMECRELHIDGNHQLDYLEDAELDAIIATTNVFSRAQPEDKVVIVNSLKRRGYLTAMTGDGVNDAPALKQADIGVSMGLNGTEVAKSASEIILLDDNFCTIVSAIQGGRKFYSNLQKFVSFLLGTNIGEILYLTVAVMLRTLPPVEALQILFLNLMTDGCPAVALSREPPDDDIMRKPPRQKSQSLMTRDWWLYGNLPHTIFEAFAVVATIIIGLYVCTGVYTIEDLHNQCKYVTLNHNDVPDKYMYYCQSYEFRVTRKYVGWVTNINYWDPKDKKMLTFFGAAEGKVANLTPNSPELHVDIKNSFEFAKSKYTVGVEQDENGWYRPYPNQTVAVDSMGRRAPMGAAHSGFINITARQARRARTMSFVAGIWCEMLRAYTVRSWEYFYKVFNRNPWMHIACSFSAIMTFAGTAVPGFSDILHCLPLSWWQYLVPILFAFVSMFLDEVLPKCLYRRKMNNELILV